MIAGEVGVAKNPKTEIAALKKSLERAHADIAERDAQIASLKKGMKKVRKHIATVLAKLGPSS